ncbi:MAG: Ig-like domain-containing protein [Chryseolinea sp.]
MNTLNLTTLPVLRTLTAHLLRRCNAAAVSLSVLVFATAMVSAEASFAVSPVLSSIGGAPVAYAEGAPAVQITSGILVSDIDSPLLAGATVLVSANFIAGEDQLSFVPTGAIVGNYDAITGVLTLTGPGTLAEYQTVLRSIAYSNSNNDNPSVLARTISFQVNDGTTNSAAVTRNVNVSRVNDAPVVSNFEPANLNFTESDPATALTSLLTILDVDGTTIANATIQITAGFAGGQDVLSFTNAFGITGTFTGSTLTLTGVATVADYQTALRSVNYQNTNTVNPSLLVRTISVRVNDGSLSSVIVTRNISVIPVNDAPVLSAIEVAGLAYAEGQAATNVTTALVLTDGDSPNLSSASVQITGNFIAAEDVLSFTAVAGITGVYNAAAGTIDFTGVDVISKYQSILRSVKYSNSNGNTPSPLTRTVSFWVSDGALTSNIATRNIVVSPVNDAPTVVTDVVTTPEEVSIDINVLANDSDVDDTIDPTTVVITLSPLNGTTSVNATTGVVTYTPNAEFSGTNTFKYTVKDLAGGTSLAATVTITVALLNDAPSFTAGTDITVSEDAGTQTIAAWATAINDGDPFTAQGLTFVFTNTNTALFASQPTINTTTGNLTFRSNNNANGVATLTVTLRDNGLNTPAPNTNLSDTKTFTISVLSINDAPVGNNEFYSTSSNTPLSANAKSNDTDTENNLTTLSPTPIVPPTNGTVVINSNGTFVYTPSGTYTGMDSFTYQICDNGTDNGVPASRCGQAIVSITVNPVNPMWNIVGNNSIELAPNAFLLTDELNNQQGAIWNRQPLDLRYSFSLDLNAIFSKPGSVRDVGADGIVFVFQRDVTPPPLNVPDLPIYARGANGGSLGIGGITPSFAVEVDTYQNGGEPVYDHIAINQNGDVWDNLGGPVPALTDASNNPLNIEDGVWHPVRIYWDFPTKTIAVDFDGVQKIISSHDIVTNIFSGDPSNVYWGFSSSTGGQNNYQAVSDIVMTVTNLPAVPATGTNTTPEEIAVSGNVLDNDSDPEGTPLQVLPETKATANGQVVILADGSYTYTPNNNYNGSDTFTYQVCDSYSPAGCAIGTENITITPVQDAPVANPDNYTTSEDTKLIVACDCILTNDVDVDGETLTPVLVKTVTHGTLVLNPDGSFTYTPDPDFFGTDTFTYTATDGIDVTSETLVTIVVTPVNDAPIAFDDVMTLDEDTPTELPILANDKDVDDQLTPAMVTVISNPAHGSITITSAGVLFTPDLNYYGPDAFTYTLTDPSGAVSNVANASITILPINDAPVSVDDAASTAEELAVTINILANDTDIDNAIEPTSVVIVSAPANGTTVVNPDGTVVYTPEKDFTGPDSFSYTVKDVAGKSSAASVVNISVLPVNDAPVAANDEATTLENISVEVHVTDNDFDVDNSVVTGSVVIFTNPIHGTIVINASGVIIYTPVTDFLGEDKFTYTIQDPDGLSSLPATVTVTVLPPNRAPQAVDNGPIVHRFVLDIPIDVIANDYDVDNTMDELTIISVTQPNVGSVTVVDNKIVFHPAGTKSAMVTFTYTISDPAGLTDEATVMIEYVYNPLTVSEGFSPNNDYNNDTWYILSIENYPNNHVKIFDRWGLMVYQKDHYENDVAPWDGRANSGQQAGKLLDQGTYYYMVDVGGEIKVLSGFVMIVR